MVQWKSFMFVFLLNFNLPKLWFSVNWTFNRSFILLFYHAHHCLRRICFLDYFVFFQIQSQTRLILITISLSTGRSVFYCSSISTTKWGASFNDYHHQHHHSEPTSSHKMLFIILIVISYIEKKVSKDRINVSNV